MHTGYEQHNLRCRFTPLGESGADIGVLYSNATLDTQDAEDLAAVCPTPPSMVPRDVAVELTLNGQQYTQSPRANWMGPVANSNTGALAPEPSGLLFNYYNASRPPTPAQLQQGTDGG